MLRATVVLSASLLALLGCGGEAEPRPQLVVAVDTDLPTVTQTTADSTLSPAAAIDTLRVDVLADDGSVATELSAVPNVDDWPVSFGVAGQAGASILLRVRVFRGAWAVPDELGETTALRPMPRLSLDRVIDAHLPESGVRDVYVLLSGDCFGAPPSFGSSSQSCVDTPASFAPSSAGILDGTPQTTRVGSWPHARELPCKHAPEPERVCIPGGFSVLGDDRLVGAEDGSLYQHDPSPARATLLSPFHLDRTEVSVGELRALMLQNPALANAAPSQAEPSEPSFEECTWRGTSDDTNDALPVNCISKDNARAICAARGGDLPTEAQWEHAARGRGEQRDFPWGNETPRCCTASLIAPNLPEEGCVQHGVEPVGSHQDPACPTRDESRDGVLDLGGSMGEHTRDTLLSFDDACWSVPGVLFDPLCETESGDNVLRGGTWVSSLGHALSALRYGSSGADASTIVGFRCAYPEPP
jgi:formylglycine-generating enzyme required for sulfatase activity